MLFDYIGLKKCFSGFNAYSYKKEKSILQRLKQPQKGLRQHANDFDSNGSTDFNKVDDMTNVRDW